MAVASSPPVAENTAGMPVFAEGLSPLEEEMVAVFADVVQALGLPKSYGEIYGLLYASPAPLSFADIEARLDLSKGSVSQGLRALREIGAVRRVESGEARRDFFAPETELRQLVGALLREGIAPRLKANAARLEQMPELLETASLPAAERKLLAGRIEKLQSWRRKASRLLPWITKILG